MRRLFTGLILGAAALVISQPAHAGILLEPILKYETGSLKGSSDATLSGTGFGARVGYETLLVFGALEYSSVNGTIKATSASYDASETQMFLDVGVHVPLLRAWVGYGFSNQIDEKFGGTTGTANITGTAYKVGVGFTGLPFVALNLEYVASTYTKQKVGGVESTLTGTSGSSLVASVSVPFDF